MINPHLSVPRADIANLCRRYQIQSLSLFGSATRADFEASSDVDVLVEFEDGAQTSLFELVDLRDDLRQVFGRDVDIATPEIFRNPYRKRTILRDIEKIYGD